MKITPSILYVSFITLFYSSPILADSTTSPLSLVPEKFEHIEFRRIPPNQHSYQDQTLKIAVEDSASFLMQAFDQVRMIKHVRFDWRSDERPGIRDEQHEKQRPGDDAVFKLGLLLKGEAGFSNPMLPGWMKRVESLLNYPSEKMMYLVADARHEAGTQWANPYNKRVTMISLANKTGKNGWHEASYVFDQPIEVVAIWLMADGDNTDSTFTTHVKNIIIE